MFPADEQPFLAAIAARPHEDGPRLVYADFLDETGNPLDARRAELVRVQVALDREPAEHPRFAELKNREAGLVADHGWLWMAPWASLGVEFQFRRGVPDAVAIDAAAFLARGEELFDNTQTGAGQSFIRRVKLRDAARFLPELANCPLLRRIEELDLGWSDLGNGGAALLMRSPHLGSVRSLELGNNGLGDAGAIALARAAVLPQLQSLALNDNEQIGDAGAAALADSPFLAGLTSLDLSGNEVTEIGVRAILAGRAMARLNRLILAENPLGNGLSALAASPLFSRLAAWHPRFDWRRCDLGAGAVAALSAAPELARVEALNLNENYLGDAGVAQLCRGNLDRLLSLEVARNQIGDAGALMLAAARMPALQRLDVSGNRLTRRGLDALKEAAAERGFVLEAANNGTETVAALPPAAADIHEMRQMKRDVAHPTRPR